MMNIWKVLKLKPLGKKCTKGNGYFCYLQIR